MNLLLDTHLLLWAATEPHKLSAAARKWLEDESNELYFSAASIWEVTIKKSLGREDFQTDPRLLRRALLDNGYLELPIVSNHAVALENLSPLHKDPFDRILVAQAIMEDLILLTNDSVVADYKGPVRTV